MTIHPLSIPATCRVCGAGDMIPLPFVAGWARCLYCGSDTSDSDPATVGAAYQTESYRDHNLRSNGSREALVETYKSNVEWFRDYRKTLKGKDFIDVGHNEGACLEAMQADGWSVHGFDVNPSANFGPHTTIAPVFRASLFPRKYHAVLCREVVEHVEGWRLLIGELAKATMAGGVCQIQTPRPSPEMNAIVYQPAHLQIHSPLALEFEVRKVGFEVCDRWIWEWGQAFMLRKG